LLQLKFAISFIDIKHSNFKKLFDFFIGYNIFRASKLTDLFNLFFMSYKCGIFFTNKIFLKKIYFLTKKIKNSTKFARMAYFFLNFFIFFLDLFVGDFSLLINKLSFCLSCFYNFTYNSASCFTPIFGGFLLKYAFFNFNFFGVESLFFRFNFFFFSKSIYLHKDLTAFFKNIIDEKA